MKLEDVLPALPPARGDRDVVALLKRLEAGERDSWNDVTRTHAPAVLARLQQAVTGVGAVDDAAGALGPKLARELHRLREPRRAAIAMLARGLSAHLAVAQVEATLLEHFLAHPWHHARAAMGAALLAGTPSTTTLERMSAAIDEDNLLPFVRHMGLAAAIRVEPATAFDRLAARYEREAVARTTLAAGLPIALSPAPVLGWQMPPIDARWYALLVDQFEWNPAIKQLFELHPEPAAIEASCALLDRRTQARAAWNLQLGFVMMAWKRSEPIPALLRAVEATMDRDPSGPLGVLEEIGDPAPIEALQALLPRATAQPAIEATIAKLAKRPAIARTKPADATKPLAKPADATPIDARETEALSEQLRTAGFGEARIAQIVALARPRILLEPRRSRKAFAAGASRFGGAPDVPAGFAWPKVGQQELEFVCQIALADVAPLDVEDVLPHDGVLAFFLDGLDARVFYFTGRLKLGAARDAKAVRFSRDRPLPPSAVVQPLGLVLSETRTYERLEDAVVEPHTMLGHARSAYFHAPPGETLLLQLRREPVDLFFMISDAALNARDFSAVRCIADEA